MKMKIMVWLLNLLFSAGIVMAQENNTSGAEIIRQLDWLEGKWSGDIQGKPFEAIYSSPEGGVILSQSKELNENSPCFFEFEKFEAFDDAVIMTPYPGGEKSVPFRLIDYKSTVKKAHFRNPEHDFPNDIIYEMPEPDRLLFTVSGKSKSGQVISFQINLVRK
jgi:hypothetical protein